MKTIKINPLMISTTDTYGGAAIAAHKLHQGLCKLNIDSKMFVQLKFSQDKNVFASKHSVLGYARIAVDKFCSILVGDVWSSSLLPTRNLKQIVNIRANIVNLHWINNTLSIAEITKLAKNYKVVWTLHDMWAISGGFHYRQAKMNFAAKILDNYVYTKKLKEFTKIASNITIVTPSTWLAKEAKKSEMFKNSEIYVIPYGVESDIFKPNENAKAELNLDQNKKYILFGAMASLKDKRKGSDLLIEALKKIKRDDVEVLVFGSQKIKLKIPQKVHFFGTVKDREKLATIYAAADVFVAPSRQDNLPNTVLEAMSCETPVVSFDIGGMPDMIAKSQRAKPFVINDLAKKIESTLVASRKLGKSAREIVLKKYTLEHSAKQYEALYGQILKEKQTSYHT
jgi:glycosyltransferase involved in cell wall biosynthesis